MSTHPQSTRAIVAHPPTSGHVNWHMESLAPRAIKDDELLIEIIATGICHTDIALSLRPPETGQYPRVLGHEGAGYVRAAGAKVSVAAPGDPVLLSFASCGQCENCMDRHPAYCDVWRQLNSGGERDVFLADAGEGSRGGLFFGQSSFVNWAVVREASVVNVSGLVRDREELVLFAPLGCGIMTGAGAVTQVVGAGDKDSLVVLGLGGVGLAAVMVSCIDVRLNGVDMLRRCRLRRSEVSGLSSGLIVYLSGSNLPKILELHIPSIRHLM
jgi:Zn-dependent alcohol dehydrogenase